MTHPKGPSTPHPQEMPPPPQAPHPTTKATPAPKTTPASQRGGNGADDPPVGTKVHVPYPTSVEVGTVTGVHHRKAGFVCMEYPNDYTVAHGVLFSTL